MRKNAEALAKVIALAHQHEKRAERFAETLAALQAPSKWQHAEPSRTKRHEVYLEREHEITLEAFQRRGGYPSRSAALRALIEERLR